MKCIGQDIGFGDVKTVIEDQMLKTPTAIAYEGFGARVDLDGPKSIEFEGQNYLVGEDAIESGQPVFETTSIDFLLRYAPLLAYHAIKAAGFDFDEKIHLGVGLPVSYYTPENKEALTNRLNTAVVNNERLKLNTLVYPQGVGAFYDYRLTTNEKISSALIVDIGYNTVDIVHISKGRPNKTGSGMFDRAGISVIIRELSRFISDRHQIQLSNQVIKEIFISKKLSLYGKEISLEEPIRQIVERYTTHLLHSLEDGYHQQLAQAQKIVITGGGAHYLKHYIPKKMQESIVIPESPEFANARGFYKVLIASISDSENVDA